jgi:subfamily B ATP-binding cassette protein MsbA
MSAADSVPPEEARERDLARRLFGTYLAPRWRPLALAAACAAIVALANAAFAKLLEPAFNEVLIEARPSDLLRIPAAIALVAVIRGLAQVGQATFVNRIGHRLVGRLQVELFGRLMRADLARLRTAHTGSYLSALLYDSGLVREAATTGVINYLQHGLTVIATLIVMATMDPWLTMLILVAAPVLSLIMRRFAKRTRKAARGAMNETSALSTAVWRAWTACAWSSWRTAKRSRKAASAPLSSAARPT